MRHKPDRVRPPWAPMHTVAVMLDIVLFSFALLDLALIERFPRQCPSSEVGDIIACIECKLEEDVFSVRKRVRNWSCHGCRQEDESDELMSQLHCGGLI